MQEMWTAVDRYLNERLVPEDAALAAVTKSNAAAGLPAIDVAPNQGKLLHMLALMQKAERILEIGTLGGYSTIWMARALPENGRLISLELSAKHAEVARGNIARAGLAERVEIRVGPALDSLAALEKERAAPFDLIFIDADKQNCAPYLEWALKLSRSGTLILCDNVVREGAIVEEGNHDPNVEGVRKFFDRAASEPRLIATALQVVGSKGYDGIALALVR